MPKKKLKPYNGPNFPAYYHFPEKLLNQINEHSEGFLLFTSSKNGVEVFSNFTNERDMLAIGCKLQMATNVIQSVNQHNTAQEIIGEDGMQDMDFDPDQD